MSSPTFLTKLISWLKPKKPEYLLTAQKEGENTWRVTMWRNGKIYWVTHEVQLSDPERLKSYIWRDLNDAPIYPEIMYFGVDKAISA